jgi:hypothetical protein
MSIDERPLRAYSRAAAPTSFDVAPAPLALCLSMPVRIGGAALSLLAINLFAMARHFERCRQCPVTSQKRNRRLTSSDNNEDS